MSIKGYQGPSTLSAASRLIIAVILIIISGSAIILSVIAHYEKKRLTEEAVAYTSSSSSIIRKSISYQMLARNPEAIQNTIENLADSDNIEAIRIFDGKGIVAYSSRPKERDAGAGTNTAACRGCHDVRGESSEILSDTRDWRLKEEGKSKHLIFSEPIYNEPSCSASDCHFHPRGQRVLGRIETVFPFSRIYGQTDRTITGKALLPIVAFCLASLAGGYLFWRLIYRRSSIYPGQFEKNGEVKSGQTDSANRGETLDMPSNACSGSTRKTPGTTGPPDVPEREAKRQPAIAEDVVSVVPDSIRDPFIILDRQYRIVKANDAYAEMREIPMKDLINAKCHEVIYKDQKRCKDCVVEKTFRSGDPCAKDKLITSKDGGESWVEIFTYPIHDEQGTVSHVIEYLRDITDRKRTEKKMKLAYLEMERIFDTAADAMCVIDEKFKILRFNNMFLNLIGRTKEDTIGRRCCDVFPGPECGTSNCYLTKMLQDPDRVIHFESERSLGVGKEAHFIITATAFRGVDGTLVGIVENFKDISKLKKTEDELRCLSRHDELTGLNNRRGFLARADQELKRAERLQQAFFLFYFDLDGLKNINDSLGHEEGDRALKTVASALKVSFRSSDIVGRIGGDEFVVMSTGSGKDGVEVISARLRGNIDILNRNNDKYKISLSTGIACYDPSHPCSINELLMKADMLMYEEKRRKKG